MNFIHVGPVKGNLDRGFDIYAAFRIYFAFRAIPLERVVTCARGSIVVKIHRNKLEPGSVIFFDRQAWNQDIARVVRHQRRRIVLAAAAEICHAFIGGGFEQKAVDGCAKRDNRLIRIGSAQIVKRRPGGPGRERVIIHRRNLNLEGLPCKHIGAVADGKRKAVAGCIAIVMHIPHDPAVDVSLCKSCDRHARSG